MGNPRCCYCHRSFPAHVIFSFFTHFIVKKTSFRFVKIKPTFKEILVLAKLGFADSLTEFSIAFVIFMYNHILIAKSGSEGLIIYTVISYISQLILMTMIGINQGMQPLVSLYYGKKAKQICRYILKVTLFSDIFLSLLAFLIGTIRPQPIVSLFIDPFSILICLIMAYMLLSCFPFHFYP